MFKYFSRFLRVKTFLCFAFLVFDCFIMYFVAFIFGNWYWLLSFPLRIFFVSVFSLALSKILTLRVYGLWMSSHFLFAVSVNFIIFFVVFFQTARWRTKKIKFIELLVIPWWCAHYNNSNKGKNALLEMSLAPLRSSTKHMANVHIGIWY